MRFRPIPVLLLAALVVPAPSSGWDTTGTDVLKRVAELDAAWAGLDHDGMTEDILERARQARRPDWVGRTAWKVSARGKTYGFGAGACPRRRDPEKAVAEAENAARAALGGMMGRERAGGALIDWYLGADGALHALAAMEFAAPQEHAEAQDYLARAEDSIKSGDFSRAKDDLDAALGLLDAEDPRRLNCHERMGFAAFQEQEFAQAYKSYVGGLKLAKALGTEEPIKGELAAGLGLTLAEQGRTDYAVKFLKAALKLNPSKPTRRLIKRKLKALTATPAP